MIRKLFNDWQCAKAQRDQVIYQRGYIYLLPLGFIKWIDASKVRIVQPLTPGRWPLPELKNAEASQFIIGEPVYQENDQAMVQVTDGLYTMGMKYLLIQNGVLTYIKE